MPTGGCLTRAPSCAFATAWSASKLAEQMLAVNDLLAAKGLQLKKAPSWITTLIAAPSSANQDKARDPDMHSSRRATSGTSA